MHLPGRLARSTLGDLLGALHRERTTGVLELREVSCPGAGRTHRIHLREGLVAAIDTASEVPPLGELLARGGRLARSSLRRLERRVAAGDPRLAGQILVAEGLAPREAVDAGLRDQVRAKLEALFRLEDARVSFHTAGGPAPAACGRALEATEFLHGRPRARDRAPTSSAEPPRAEPPPGARGQGAASGVDPERRAAALRLLGLTEGARPDDVRRAFRRLAGELHPDRHRTDSPADQERVARLARVTAAYHLLVA
jgi:hypothetical protein